MKKVKIPGLKTHVLSKDMERMHDKRQYKARREKNSSRNDFYLSYINLQSFHFLLVTVCHHCTDQQDRR